MILKEPQQAAVREESWLEEPSQRAPQFGDHLGLPPPLEGRGFTTSVPSAVLSTTCRSPGMSAGAKDGAK